MLMHKLVFVIAFALLCGVSTLYPAHADFSVSHAGTVIEKNYQGGEVLRGTLNISFRAQENERIQSTFTPAEGISLLALLQSTSYVPSQQYQCTPSGCRESYTPTRDQAVASASFDSEGAEQYGLYIQSDKLIETIKSATFLLNSTAPESCVNQLEVDVLGDGSVDAFNQNYIVSHQCALSSIFDADGCFETDRALENVPVTSSYSYCEKISFPAAPAYELGANLTPLQEGSQNQTFIMNIYRYPVTSQSGEVRRCSFSLSAGGVGTCIVPVSSRTAWDALVCVHIESGSNTFAIRERSKSNSCGLIKQSTGIWTSGSDYEVYGWPLQYGSVSSLTINESSSPQTLNSSVLNAYLRTVYGMDCTQGCVIPIQIKNPSSTSYTVGLQNGRVIYKEVNGTDKYRDGFMPASLQPVIIDSGFITIPLSLLNVSVPNLNGTRTVKVSLGDKALFEEPVTISQSFDFRVEPIVVAVGTSIELRAVGDAPIVSSQWTVDGGLPVEGSGATFRFTFAHAGEYTVTTRVTNTVGQSSLKTFKIFAGHVRDSTNATISDRLQRISRVRATLQELGAPEQQSIEKYLNLTNLNNALIALRTRFGQASTDTDYETLLTQALVLDVPLDVHLTKRGVVPFAVGYDSMNIQHIPEIFGEETDHSFSAHEKELLLQWMQAHYDSQLAFETFEVTFDSGVKELGTLYVADITSREGEESSSDTYLVIGRPLRDVYFLDDLDIREVYDQTAVYTRLNAQQPHQMIPFFVSGAIANTPRTIGAYIAPAPSLIIDTSENVAPYTPAGFPWLWFILGLCGVLILFFVLYIFVQEWYKRNYEKTLFKNPDDVYNVINFIYNARVGGMNDKDIRKSLLAKKWTHEQVVYAFHKIDGKRTGLWEIPLFKKRENAKVKSELERMNPGKPVDARFIKRPYSLPQ